MKIVTNTADQTIAEILYSSASNLAMAFYALTNGLESTSHECIMYRNGTYSRFKNKQQTIREFLDEQYGNVDFKHKCAYCGLDAFTVDHIIPQKYGGDDFYLNLFPACRSCNSSKGSHSILNWFKAYNKFPSLKVMQQVLSLLEDYCIRHSMMEMRATAVTSDIFEFSDIPTSYPPDLQPRHIYTSYNYQSSANLLDVIDKCFSISNPGFKKLFETAGILTWEDITEESLSRLKSLLSDNVSQSTANTYSRLITSMLGRHEYMFKAVDYRRILYVQPKKNERLSLTKDEIGLLYNCKIKGNMEQFVKDCFIVEAFVGVKHSEVLDCKVKDNHSLILTTKTGQKSFEASSFIIQAVSRIQDGLLAPTLVGYNNALRRIAKKAHILDGRDSDSDMLYSQISASTAIITHNALGLRSTDSIEEVFSDISLRIRLPINKRPYSLSDSINQRIKKSGIPIAKISQATEIETTRLESFLNGEMTDLYIEEISRLLWIVMGI